MDIFPSYPAPTITDFDTQLDHLLPYFNTMQIDIVDNMLVKGTSITTFEALQRLILNPITTGKAFDFHLMIKDYQKDLSLLQDYVSRLNIRYVLIHAAANPPPEIFLRQPYGFKLGIVVNPDETIDTINHKYVIDRMPVIQLMTVIPGAQGRPFIPDTLNKIDQLRNLDYRSQIMLDGGINLDSFKLIMQRDNKPDVVCPGSYFVHSKNVQESIEILMEEITRATKGS